MKIEIKQNFNEIDQVMFEAELEVFFEQTVFKLKEYVV
jgi:hypothetical protein